MPTIKQLIKKRRINNKKRNSRTTGLQGCPQKKGTCLRAFWMPPKKPNSANRRVTKIILTNWKQITAHIPGIGHSLQRHSHVLVRGGRVKDLPGMKYRVIRGVGSLEGLNVRCNGRSKYGAKREKE